MKQIPNFFTLLNLVFGCIAIVLVLQTGTSIVTLDASGATEIVLPERIWWGGLFLFLAAVVDFFDGFLARLFKASSAMGAQLDSLSDMVSFGVAPGVILYQLLRLSYAQHENGLDVSVWALLPAFLFTVAVAWRLAKFNISTNQSHSFRGIPSPAAGLVVASFPLILLYQYYNVHGYLVNEWVLYGIIVLLSWLMVCDRRFMALKFKDFSFRNNAMKYFLLGAALVLILLLHWLAVPAIFLLYVLLSVFDKEPAAGAPTPGKDSLDVTV